MKELAFYEARHSSYRITQQNSKTPVFQNSHLFLHLWGSLWRIWGKWNAQYHSSAAMSFFKVSLYQLKPFSTWCWRKSESWESAYILLNWHLSLCQNYYDVNVCNECFFVKSCPFIGFSTYRLWKGNEVSIFIPWENNLQQNQPSQNWETSLKQTPLVFCICWWKKFLGSI
jgi:hypothetical protein